MATVKKGVLTRPPEWWKHLRWTKKKFWRKERRAAIRQIRKDIVDADLR